MAASFRSWDDYLVPGTRVLRNKLGLKTPEGLADAEERLAGIRLVELAAKPVEGRFDYEHMKEIHRRIFQDVYVWAGQERVGPEGLMTKAGPDVVNFEPGDPAAPDVAYGYYPAPAIAEAAATQYERLAKADHLVGLDADEFVRQLAETWAELNVIHSFREGNTRTQIVFFSQLCENAGRRLDTAAFIPGDPRRDEFVAARFYNQATTRTDRLENMLAKVVTPAARPKGTDPLGDRRRRFPELFAGEPSEAPSAALRGIEI